MNQDLTRSTPLVVPSRAARTPESWRDAGLCRDKDPNLFYPLGRGQSAIEQTELAKAFCRACPSKAPCLAFALQARQELGVWGGTSPEERRVLLGRGRRTQVAS